MITDVLRGTLGYNGIVMTDMLGDSAITARYSDGDAAVAAIVAGGIFCCVLQISVRHIRVCWMQCQPERLQKRGFRNLSTESIV